MNEKTQRAIIEQKLEGWRNTKYSVEVDIKLAKAIDDESVLSLEPAVKRLREIIRVIGELEKMLVGISQEIEK